MRAEKLVIAAALLTACAALSCDEADDSFAVGPSPTQVGVNPGDFLGDVRCSTNAGAMQSYVLSLKVFDDEDDVSGFSLGSSPATPCSMIAAFRNVVVVGKTYTAEIDGYQRPASELVPLGDPSSGARQMLDAATGEPMTPRWSTACGEDGVVAFENQTTLVRPCQPLVDADSSTTTIRVAASDVLGADPCSVASSFDLEVRAGDLTSQSAIGCDEPPRLLESAAGRTHQFYAFATGLDGIARGTSCAATALAGESVPLSCQPLSSQGAADVSLVGLQGVSGPACPEGHAFDVLLDGAAVNAVPIACSATAHIAPLEPGTTTLVAQVYQPGGALFGTPLSCLVEVRPGDNSVAACGL